VTDDARFEELLGLYVDGKAATPEIAELESLLRQDASRRKAFVERVRVHVDLHALFEGARESAAPAERPPTRRTHRRIAGRPGNPTWTAGLVAAGILIGFVALLLLSASGSNSEEAAELSRRRIAKEDARRKADQRLREIEREREQILAKPVTSEGKPDAAKEEERQKALQDLAERRRRIDEELKAALEREKPDVVVQKTPEEAKPVPTPAAPQEKKSSVLAATVARFGKIDGDVFVLVAGERKPAAPGMDIGAGQGIDTVGNAEILYPDKTRVELGPGSSIRDISAENGKRFRVERGIVRAEVRPQPKAQPMILESATGEATVLGTTLKLMVDPDPAKGTRLELEEGKVQLKNLLSGKTVLVETGHYAVAAAGMEFKSTALPINEIVLVPSPDEKRVKRTGVEWRLIKDESSPVGYALESIGIVRPLTTDLLQLPSYVTMTFEADAGKDYYIWVRGECKGTGLDRGLQDAVALKFARGQVTQKLTPTEWIPMGTDGAGFSGWGREPGPGWIGGDGDYFDSRGVRAGNIVPGAKRGDETPGIVRFTRPGTQTLRMYLLEGPMKIDVIWMSTTQKTRPDAGLFGPVKK
jgi:hypothetical protein